MAVQPEVLLEEAEGMLDGEAALIPAPQRAQIRRQRPAMPDQPQRLGRLLAARQARPALTRMHGQLDGRRRLACAAASQTSIVTVPVGRVGVGLGAVGDAVGGRIVRKRKTGPCLRRRAPCRRTAPAAR